MNEGQEIPTTEAQFRKALEALLETAEAVKKLTPQDGNQTITRVLRAATEARRRLAEKHRNLIDAHRWRLNR